MARGLTLCLAVRIGDFVPTDGALMVVRRVPGDPGNADGWSASVPRTSTAEDATGGPNGQNGS